MDESQAVAFHMLGPWWDSWIDPLKLPWIGNVDFSGEYEDDEIYLVVASGGQDIDPEARSEIAIAGTEYEPRAVQGQLFVYAFGAHLKENRYGLNPLAGAVSHYLIGVALADQDVQDDGVFRERLDEGAMLLTQDVDGDGVANWEDLLAFNMQFDMPKFRGDPALLEAYIEATISQEWTPDKLQMLFDLAEELVVDAWRKNRQENQES
jgi:hypothetical protein